MTHRPNPFAGSFNDRSEHLLEQLAGPPPIALDMPVRRAIDLPTTKRRPRIGRCAALHNRLLLDAQPWAEENS